jgi:ribonuclease PH
MTYGPLGEFGEIVPALALLACAVIPSALKSEVAAISVGCMGARTFADLREEELLVAVPASALATLAERRHEGLLPRTARAFSLEVGTIALELRVMNCELRVKDAGARQDLPLLDAIRQAATRNL